jgi:hypothetical protein
METFGNICFRLFIAEEAGLDKERRREEGWRERSGGINWIFVIVNCFYKFETKCHIYTEEESIETNSEQTRSLQS